MTQVTNRNPRSTQAKRLLGAAVGAAAATAAKAQCYETDVQPVGAGIQLNGTSYGLANIHSQCMQWIQGYCSSDSKGYTSCSPGYWYYYDENGYGSRDLLKRLVDMLAKGVAGFNRTFNASVVGGYPIPSNQPVLAELHRTRLIGPDTGTEAERALITAFQNEVSAERAADNKKTAIIVGSVIGGLAFLGIVVCICCCCCAKGRRRRTGDIEVPEVPRGAAVASVLGATAGAAGAAAAGAAGATAGATTSATAGAVDSKRQTSSGAEAC